MKLLHMNCLVAHGEADGAIVLDFHILHVGGKLADIAEDSEIARRLHGAMNINVALHGGMPGNAALQVGAYQRVKVEMLELDCDLAGKVVKQVQAAVNIQSGILKN